MASECCGPRTRPFHDDSGQVLLMTALLIPVLLGFAGLSLDVGSWYSTRSDLEQAADAAAHSAAIELKRTNDPTTLQNFGAHAAAQNLIGAYTVVVTSPPTTGPLAAQAGYVEAIVTRTVPTNFVRLFGRPTVTISARAVAGGPNVPPCVTATGDGKAATKVLTVSGSATLKVPSCTLNANGSIVVSGSASIDATPNGAVSAVGTATGSITPAPKTGAAPAPDPFATVPQPFDATTNPCVSPYGLGSVVQGLTVRSLSQASGGTNLASPQPGIYCGGLKWSGNNGGTLTSGTYILYGGGFTDASSGSITGTDITIFNTGGGSFTAKPITISGGSARADLRARTTGSLAGILFFQDRGLSSPPDFTFSGGSAAVALTGTIYITGGDITYSSGSSSSTAAYTFLLGKTVTFSGSSTLSTDVSGIIGGAFVNGDLAE
jgi:Flp pilus assembly protein TadG